MSVAPGLGGHQSPALWHQAPWEEPLRDRNIVRVSPEEAGLPYQRDVWQAEGRVEVKALGMESVGLRLWRGGPWKMLVAQRALPVLPP